jgi:hypothetical protein
MDDYTIRYVKPGGGLALVYMTACTSDGDARKTALQMLAPDYDGFEIWHGAQCVETFSRAGEPATEYPVPSRALAQNSN